MEIALMKDMNRELSEVEESREMQAIEDALNSSDKRVRRTGADLLHRRLERHERRRREALRHVTGIAIAALNAEGRANDQPVHVTTPVQVNIQQGGELSPDRAAARERLRREAWGNGGVPGA